MSRHRYEDVPRTLRLTDGARLEDDRIVVRAQVFRGEVQLDTDEVYLSIDDASVLNAQLSRLLDRFSSPGLEERRRERMRQRREQWGY